MLSIFQVPIGHWCIFFCEMTVQTFLPNFKIRFFILLNCRVFFAAAAAAKSCQSCPTLCNPRDGSPPGSPVPGILQATTLEWVAISFSNAWKWKVKIESGVAQLCLTPWTAAYQAPPSTGFSRQEYWSGVPLPSPRVFFGGGCKCLVRHVS